MYVTIEMMKIENSPVAKAEMLIRKPVAEVFEAFVNPDITTKFWFTKSSGKLKAGQQVKWEWEMYGVSDLVDVKEIEQNKRILIEWDLAHAAPNTVEWIFTARADNTTFVSITNSDFSGDGDEIVSKALNSAGAFAIVLASLKAFLEHNINLNLIADHSPDKIKKL